MPGADPFLIPVAQMKIYYIVMIVVGLAFQKIFKVEIGRDRSRWVEIASDFSGSLPRRRRGAWRVARGANR